ncbi:hypothetical protein A3K63_01500 [Candidatus Micrarchaeota archaeon RBG_16_49_10]|nr:MAG: hypothetical protein A3K63_01500 [Candidatus Micrarchaeota archaeon RBG_16_49_10]
MSLTLADITPMGLCLATQDLLDAKRFQSNFCDNLLLRDRDPKIVPLLTGIKRDLNSSVNQGKFLDGHKAAIVSNIDKIIGLVTSRYSQADPKAAEKVIEDAKDMLERVVFSDNFEQLARLEPVFKKEVTLPVYELFMTFMKRANA